MADARGCAIAARAQGTVDAGPGVDRATFGKCLALDGGTSIAPKKEAGLAWSVTP